MATGKDLGEGGGEVGGGEMGRIYCTVLTGSAGLQTQKEAGGEMA